MSKILEPGTLLKSRYRIASNITGGGINLYLAQDHHLCNSPCMIRELVFGTNERLIRDFEQRIARQAGLDHPAFPAFYDHFIDGESGYLVMKYLSGGNLRQRIDAAPDLRISELKATNWAIEIADALDHLHTRNLPLFHCELHPETIYFDSRDRLYLSDAGSGRFALPQEGSMIKPNGYMPAETLSNSVDARSDIYSLGAIMFQMVTGVDPCNSPILIFNFNRSAKPRQINAEITPDLEDIICQAVDQIPERRFATVAVLKERLITHLKQLESSNVKINLKRFDPTCPHCYNLLKYCPGCGSMLNPVIETPSKPAHAFAKLVMADPDSGELEFQLDKDSLVIGRKDPSKGAFPDVNLAPLDIKGRISRMHARISRKAEHYLLEDMESVNGTFIIRDKDQRKLYPNRPEKIEHGDLIRFANITLKFLLNGQVLSERAAIVPARAEINATRVEINSAETAKQQPTNGLQIDNYQIDQVLGEGAFGWVLSGVDGNGNRRAFKVARPSRLRKIFSRHASHPMIFPALAFSYGSEGIYHNEPDPKELLIIEFERLKNLSDPLMVAVEEVSINNPLCYYRMEHIEGRSLRELFTSNQRISVKLFLDLVAALERIKRAQPEFLHGDLKPENIIVSDQQIKLIDPGFRGSINTANGQNEYLEVTTRAYNLAFIIESDLFAMLIMIWEAACREHPLQPVMKYLVTANHIEYAGRGPINNFLFNLSTELHSVLEKRSLRPEINRFLRYIFGIVDRSTRDQQLTKPLEPPQPIKDFSTLSQALSQLLKQGIEEF